MDADAYLFYGFPLSEDSEETLSEWENDDWTDEYAKRVGVVRPEAEYSDETKAAYSEYWRRVRAVAEASGVEVGYSGWLDEPQHFLSAHTLSAYYGQVLPVTMDDLAVDGQWAARLDDFCTLMGLDYEAPRWYLTNLLSS